MENTIYVTESGYRVVVTRREGGRVFFVAHGGGFRQVAPEAQFDADFKWEVAPPAYRRIDTIMEMFKGEVFPAYSNGERWNGWALPYFEYQVAVKVAHMISNKTRYDRDTETFTIPDDDYPAEPYTYKSQLITVNGAKIKVWGAGTGSWCWEEAPPPDPDNANDRRSASANEGLKAFAEGAEAEPEDALADLLCNLMHLCDRTGQDFLKEFGRAGRNYLEETRQD